MVQSPTTQCGSSCEPSTHHWSIVHLLSQRVVEAFGARKCPRLIEQLQMPQVHVRIAALRAVANVLRNPYDVVSCINAGIIR